MARKLKNGSQSRAPIRWGEVAGNITAGRHHRCPGGVPCMQHPVKKETGERERQKIRCQGLARGQNTKDDDDNDDDDVLCETTDGYFPQATWFGHFFVYVSLPLAVL